jgi:hypothetical protein
MHHAMLHHAKLWIFWSSKWWIYYKLFSGKTINILIFIAIYKSNNFGFVMFWIFFFNVIKKLNFTNDKYSYWLRQLIFLSMINEHIISAK